MLAVVLDCVHFPLFHNIADNSEQNLVTAMLQLFLSLLLKKEIDSNNVKQKLAQKEEFPQIIKVF